MINLCTDVRVNVCCILENQVYVTIYLVLFVFCLDYVSLIMLALYVQLTCNTTHFNRIEISCTVFG